MGVPDLSVMSGRNRATLQRVAITFAPEAGVPSGLIVWNAPDDVPLDEVFAQCVTMIRAAQVRCEGVSVPVGDGNPPLWLGAFAVERVAAIAVITLVNDSEASPN